MSVKCFTDFLKWNTEDEDLRKTNNVCKCKTLMDNILSIDLQGKLSTVSKDKLNYEQKLNKIISEIKHCIKKRIRKSRDTNRKKKRSQMAL